MQLKHILENENALFKMIFSRFTLIKVLLLRFNKSLPLWHCVCKESFKGTFNYLNEGIKYI